MENSVQPPVEATAAVPAKETRRQRIARKRADKAAREAKLATWAVDPLVCYDRYKQPTSLRDLWKGSAAFLVCGGPSLNDYPKEAFKERGIVSLGINNVAAHVHCKAMVFSDPPNKFHGGVWLDPSIIKFVPLPKIERRNDDHKIRLKPAGKFLTTGLYPEDCPGVVAFERDQSLVPADFLRTTGAQWGVNKKFEEISGRPKILFTFFIGLRLLHYLGVRRIFLVGADFSMTETKGYAFAQGREGAVDSNNTTYRMANLICRDLRPVFEAAGLFVFNCYQHSGLQAWDYVPFAEAHRICKGHVPPEPFDVAHWYEKILGQWVPDGVDPAQWLADRRREQEEQERANGRKQ